LFEEHAINKQQNKSNVPAFLIVIFLEFKSQRSE